MEQITKRFNCGQELMAEELNDIINLNNSIILYIRDHESEWSRSGSSGGDRVQITPVGNSGLVIAKFKINDNPTESIYAPTATSGQGGGNSTIISPRNFNYSKVAIADYVDSNGPGILYAPIGEGGGGGSDTPKAGYLKTYFANVAKGTTAPNAPLASNYSPAPTDAFTTSNPQWTRTNVNPSDDLDTYAIWVYFDGNDNIITIDGPIKLNGGGGGSNGEDGEEIEWIYFRTQTELDINGINTIQNYLETCKGNVSAHKWNGSSWTSCTFKDADAVPLGGGQDWTDNAQGIDETYKYEYAAFRRSENNEYGKRTWGNDYFHGPMLWSAFGKQGTDGDGVEYIFYANATGTFPTSATYNPQNWTNDTNFLNPEYIRNNTGWMDNPIDLSQSGLGLGAVEWVSMRKKQNNQWQAYSAPAVWTRMAKDGGAPKEVDYNVLYFRAMTTHNVPSQDAATAPTQWHEGEDPNWSASCPYLYCQEKTVYKDGDFSWGNIYYKGKWIEGGGSGSQGADGYTLIIDPSYAIFGEDVKRIGTDGNEITFNNGLPSAAFDHYEVIPMDLNSWTGHVQLFLGSTLLSIGFGEDDENQLTSGTTINGDNCTFQINIINNGDLKGLEIIVKSIATSTLTTAKMHFWVFLNNSGYCLVEIPIYINRLGTHFQYIVGDSETTIMRKLVYFDENSGNWVSQYEYMGEYLRSSQEFMSTLRTDVNNVNSSISTIRQTSDAISLGVQNGWYNYITNPLATEGSIGSVDSLEIIEDSTFGKVLKLSKNTAGDWQLRFNIDSKYEELTNKTVTWFCIVKTLNNDGSSLNFGSGYESSNNGNQHLALHINNNGGTITVSMGLTNPTGYNYYDLSTERYGDRILNDGWHLCWASVKLGTDDNTRSIIPGTSDVGFNTMSGTWEIYYAGIVMGQGYPSIDMILQGAGIKKAGIDITNGTIDLAADKTTFSYYENGVKKSDKIWIDNTTGTLHAVNGEFTGIIHATGGDITGTLNIGSSNTLRKIILNPNDTWGASIKGMTDNNLLFYIGFGLNAYGNYIPRIIVGKEGLNNNVTISDSKITQTVIGTKLYEFTQGNTSYGTGYQIEIPAVCKLNLGLSNDKIVLAATDINGASIWPKFTDDNDWNNITEKGRVYAVPSTINLNGQTSNKWAYLMVRVE